MSMLTRKIDRTMDNLTIYTFIEMTCIWKPLACLAGQNIYDATECQNVMPFCSVQAPSLYKFPAQKRQLSLEMAGESSFVFM